MIKELLFIYGLTLFMNFFIPSGSAKAILLMPLIVPIAQVFDISAQLCIVAFAFGDLGDHSKAMELHKKLYALRCEKLGEEHPNTVYSLIGLANSYGDLGDYNNALELYKRAYGKSST